MSVPFLEKASGLSAVTIATQIRAAHERLPKEQCMGYRHELKFPGKDSGCDIHKVEE